MRCRLASDHCAEPSSQEMASGAWTDRADDTDRNHKRFAITASVLWSEERICFETSTRSVIGTSAIKIPVHSLREKAAEDCRTPRRFATTPAYKLSEGFGVRQSSAAFSS